MTTTMDLTTDELLSTTRAVRKRLDLNRPVPIEVVRECLEIATQAPNGSNMQNWHFMVVTDAGKRERIAELYNKSFEVYRTVPFAAGNIVTGESDRDATQQRVMSSAEYLNEVLARVPVLLIPCVEGRVETYAAMLDGTPFGQLGFLAASAFGSIAPATWSFCLAARARGLGMCWTTLHLAYEREAAEVLGIPYESVTQVALIPVAYTKGMDFKPAPRVSLDQVLHIDAW
jgi:nitroreductase